MDVAASGGYYVALAADTIVAHPTTVTGSIGVIMLSLNAEGLMQKLGLATDAFKSGERKDMGSPFRTLTDEERKIFQSLIDGMYGQFLSRVVESRKLPLDVARRLADGRVYTAQQALDRSGRLHGRRDADHPPRDRRRRSAGGRLSPPLGVPGHLLRPVRGVVERSRRDARPAHVRPRRRSAPSLSLAALISGWFGRRLEAFAAGDREPRILRKAGIRRAEVAPHERREPGRRDVPGVTTREAETRRRRLRQGVPVTMSR
jgi:hypothetical protein